MLQNDLWSKLEDEKRSELLYSLSSYSSYIDFVDSLADTRTPTGEGG